MLVKVAHKENASKHIFHGTNEISQQYVYIYTQNDIQYWKLF